MPLGNGGKVVRILLTGGTGFIGCTVVPYLLALGHDVVLLVRESYVSDKLLPMILQRHYHDLQFVYADLSDFSQTKKAVQDAAPTAVIHLAAAGATDPFLPIHVALQHNLHGTLHLLEACFNECVTVEKVVVARTPGEKVVMNMYAASKLSAWNMCQLYARTQQWPIVGAMIYQAYGWGQANHALVPSAFGAAVNGNDFPMTHGSQLRDWIAVDDVVVALITLMNASIMPGETVEIGSGIVHSLADVVQSIYHVVGRGGRPLLGMVEDRPGELSEQKAAADACLAAIGFQATTSLMAGLEKYKTNLLSEK